MLVKKDRGRPSDPTARPKAYGEVSVASAVPGVELLQNDDDDEDDDNIGSDEDVDTEDSDDGGSLGIDNSVSNGSDDENATSDDEETPASTDDNECDDESLEGDSVHGEDSSSCEDFDEVSSDEVDEDEDAKADCSDDNVVVHDEVNTISETNSGEEKTGSRVKISETRKRKFTDLDGQINAAETSLRALKKLAETKLSQPPSDLADGILSNEDFHRIKQLKVLKFAYDVLKCLS